jgi:predicted dehydrogenase
VSDRRIRAGVIGCGEISQIMHLPFLHQLPEFELAAICDVSPTVLDAVGERYGVADRFERFEDLVAADVDAVVVATPDHVAPSLAALDAGRHLLVEKPLAFDPAQARAVTEAAAAAGVVAMVGYMKRYDPGFEYAVERISQMPSVRMGRIHDFAGRFDKQQEWTDCVRGTDVPDAVVREGRELTEHAVRAALGDRYDAHASLYLTLLMLGSHDMAVMRGAFGAPTEVLTAHALDQETLVATVVCGKSTTCVLELSAGTDYEWWDQSLTAYGDTETVTVSFPNPYAAFAPAVVRVQGAANGRPEERVSPVSHDEAFRRELRHFAHCIATGETPRTPIAAGAADVELGVELIRRLPS